MTAWAFDSGALIGIEKGKAKAQLSGKFLARVVERRPYSVWGRFSCPVGLNGEVEQAKTDENHDQQPQPVLVSAQRQAMLTELSLRRFKGHHDTRIPLQRLTVLVGPNASGKTSALEALQILSLAFSTPAEELFSGGRAFRWLLRQGSAEAMRLSVSGLSDTQSWQLGLEAAAGVEGDEPVLVKLPPGEVELRYPKRYHWRIGDQPEETAPLSGLYKNLTYVPPPKDSAPWHAAQRPTEWGPIPPQQVRSIENTAWFRLDARRLAQPSYSDAEVPRLEEDGYGLATLLSVIKLRSTEQFRALEAVAQQIVPHMRGLGFKRTRVERQAPRTLTVEGQKVLVHDREVIIADELLLDFDDAKELPAHAASEGSLIVLGILAALHGPARARLMLLDDLERGLHPKAQRDLVNGLRAALDASPEMQIVATTHSPYLIDGLAPEEVVVLGRGPDGVIVAKRLSDHPNARLLDALTTGEFWTAEGEEWVAA